MSSALLPSRILTGAVTALCAFLFGCGGGGGGNSTGPGGGGGGGGASGSFGVAASATTLTMPIGGSGTVTYTISRTNGFTGAVSMAVSGAPSGVAAIITPLSVDPSSTIAVLAVVAGPTAVVGTSTLTITASASGQASQTRTVQLVITGPSLTLSLNPGALSVAAGQSGTATVALTRGNGFAASVTLALEGAPASVTFSLNPASTTGASVAAGTYNLTVRGTATGGVNAATPLSLTVAASGPVGFTLSLDPPVMELSPAVRSQSGFVNISRTTYNGPVTFSVSGLSLGVFVAVSPASTTINASNVLVIAPVGTAPGTYTGIIKASAPGFADQTATFTVKVVPATTGSIKWRFCAPDRVPLYFAVKDGSGPWTHVLPDSDTFAFNLSSSTGAVATVNLGEKTAPDNLIQGFAAWAFHGTAQEIQTLATADCNTYPNFVTPRNASGNASGISITNFANISMSRVATSVSPPSGQTAANYTLINILPGPHDLIGGTNSFGTIGAQSAIIVGKVIVKRGQNPASGGTLPLMDFNAAEAVPPSQFTATVSGGNGDTFSVFSSMTTANGTYLPFDINFLNVTTTARPIWGLPAALLAAGDLHQYQATTGDPNTTRTVSTFRAVPADVTMSFGSSISAPSLSTVAGGATGLVRMQGNLPLEYNAAVQLFLRESIADPRKWTLIATRGWLSNTTTYDVQLPDLSALTGWTKAWNLRTGAPTPWIFTVGGGIVPGLVTPTSGTLLQTALVKGTVIP
jgi:hypothetical protein